MAAFNHNLKYRPLRGGIAVLNPIVNKTGTIGFIATSDDQDRWMISCYHVLGRIDFSLFAEGEPIYQPSEDMLPAVAAASVLRSNAALDCAAAKLEPGVDGVGHILGLCPLTGLSDPVVGMRVIKSGCVTGVTEGLITDVQGNEVVIGLLPGFAANFELSAEGDSGAAWVEASTGAIVALHKAGSSFGAHEARGTSIKPVLAALQLRLIA